MNSFEDRVREAKEWMASPRFKGIVRLYSPRQVAEQRGTIPTAYPIARKAAEEFYARLRELFQQRKSITTFGPYSPGTSRHHQAVWESKASILEAGRPQPREALPKIRAPILPATR